MQVIEALAQTLAARWSSASNTSRSSRCGLDLRLEVDGDLEPKENRCEPGSGFVALMEIALAWKGEFVQRGWV